MALVEFVPHPPQEGDLFDVSPNEEGTLDFWCCICAKRMHYSDRRVTWGYECQRNRSHFLSLSEANKVALAKIPPEIDDSKLNPKPPVEIVANLPNARDKRFKIGDLIYVMPGIVHSDSGLYTLKRKHWGIQPNDGLFWSKTIAYPGTEFESQAKPVTAPNPSPPAKAKNPPVKKQKCSIPQQKVRKFDWD